MTITIDELKRHLLETIKNKHEKITPRILVKTISQRFPINRQNIRSTIKALVMEGQLSYTHVFGQSYIEKSFQTPLRASSHIVIKPPEITYPSREKDTIINIQQGASFGDGHHPSTRLALRGIEYVLHKSDLLEKKKKPRMLDIGTGSGILAITALKMGFRDAVGVDTDPCAAYESKRNAAINGLENRYVFLNQPVDAIQGTFQLITANLRSPTLTRVCSKIYDAIDFNGAIVLSGMKSAETSYVKQTYAKNNFDCFWSEEDTGWTATLFFKKMGGNMHNR